MVSKCIRKPKISPSKPRKRKSKVNIPIEKETLVISETVRSGDYFDPIEQFTWSELKEAMLKQALHESPKKQDIPVTPKAKNTIKGVDTTIQKLDTSIFNNYNLNCGYCGDIKSNKEFSKKTIKITQNGRSVPVCDKCASLK